MLALYIKSIIVGSAVAAEPLTNEPFLNIKGKKDVVSCGLWRVHHQNVEEVSFGLIVGFVVGDRLENLRFIYQVDVGTTI